MDDKSISGHSINSDSILRDFCHSLLSTVADSREEFSGIGMMIYDENFHLDKCIALRPNLNIPKNLYLGEESTTIFLCEISNKEHPAHDGYILFNSEGVLTHVAQYLCTPMNNDIKPHPNHGVRYITSTLASQMPGVILVGNASTDKSAFLFISGNSIQLDTPRSKKTVNQYFHNIATSFQEP
ncbi:hypothetical protein JW710_05095 [Candidatus Dojkabacteria bacterium]|nr:hypothetical protein [Candidatus Dojkabacteria bacterium]